jgi:hypothetical protein
MTPIKQQAVKILTQNIKDKTTEEVFDIFSPFFSKVTNQFPWESNIKYIEDKEIMDLLTHIVKRRKSNTLSGVYGMNFLFGGYYRELGYSEGESILEINNESINLSLGNSYIIGYHNEDFIVKLENKPEIYLIEHEELNGFKVADNIREAIHFFMGLSFANMFGITSEEYISVYEEEHGDALKTNKAELFIGWLSNKTNEDCENFRDYI